MHSALLFHNRLHNNSQSSRKLSRLNLFSYTEIISLNDMLYKVLISNTLIKTVSFVLNCIAGHCTDGLALFLPSPYRLKSLQFSQQILKFWSSQPLETHSALISPTSYSIAKRSCTSFRYFWFFLVGVIPRKNSSMNLYRRFWLFLYAMFRA